ncbi:hypothetical protein VN12_03950 [Pirellula sp. SH-Sr6A]|uniref:hypothetical protein n=1 Tax=Pirellula sp. SH-Sr6A TaxID=1632865 RepID=UPI00078D9F9E|nr:hypothetical protein [Pirellula sp. SH-Sr6A]AMV31247.1 hypothetical protein VN12_03950 [Pirellula sp. SH-Sr6A]
MKKLTNILMLLSSTALVGCNQDDNSSTLSTSENPPKLASERSEASRAIADSLARAVSNQQEEKQPRLDTPFYVYGLGEPTSTDFWQGSQFFGTMDKVGVLKSVMDQIPNRQADLIFIRDRKADREAYLTQNGIALDSQGLWDVGIEVTDLVNGKRRLGVTASYGKDIEINGGIGQHVVKNVTEIWELQDNGADPILLERHSLPNSATVHTQSEVPSYITEPPSPPGTIGY